MEKKPWHFFEYPLWRIFIQTASNGSLDKKVVKCAIGP